MTPTSGLEWDDGRERSIGLWEAHLVREKHLAAWQDSKTSTRFPYDPEALGMLGAHVERIQIIRDRERWYADQRRKGVFAAPK